MDRRLTLVQQMILVVGYMQTVLESNPRADKQVRSAIHHWELAITAEGGELDREKIPNRD